MPCVLIFHDDDGTAELRSRLRPDHREYLNKNVHRLLASGALLRDDGKEEYGGLIVLDTDERSEAELFVSQDPFWIAKVYSTYTISRWRKAYFAFQNCLSAKN
jgi:hypothetical protein